MLTVKVFAAGGHDHAGNGVSVPNSFGADSADLVKSLLEKAGYKKDLHWECRIDKMRHCSHESRPIRVVGYKVYGVSLRVKLKENSTVDQLCTLLIPSGSGYSAKNLYEQLKASEKSISQRKEKTEKTEKTEIQPQLKINIPKLPSTIVEAPPIPLSEEKKESLPATTWTADLNDLQESFKSKLSFALRKLFGKSRL